MSVRYQPRWPGMTLNGVIALILRFSRNSIALLANYVTVVEDRHRGLCLHNVYMYNVRKYCLPVPVSHFWPKLTHPAALSLCDSWATCSELHTLVRYNNRLFFYSTAILRRYITCRLWFGISEIKVLIAKSKLKFLAKFIQSSNVLCQMFADSAHAESSTYSACSDRLI